MWSTICDNLLNRDTFLLFREKEINTMVGYLLLCIESYDCDYEGS
jgi:hypothetical protein